jgi:Flp pilus assembly protein TadB
MDPAVVVVLLIVGAFVAIIAVQAGTGAVIETAFDKAGRVLEDRSKPKERSWPRSRLLT